MTTDQLAIDAVFDVLADDHRRALLSYLQDASEASIDELAAVISRQGDAYRQDDRESEHAVRLHHVHLPKLADANLVEYDRRAGRVEYVGGSDIADLLATAPRGMIAE